MINSNVSHGLGGCCGVSVEVADSTIANNGGAGIVTTEDQGGFLVTNAVIVES